MGRQKAMLTALAVASVCGAVSFQALPSTHTEVTALQIVQRKFDAFNRHDAEEIERLYASGAHLHSPDHPDLAGNKAIADTYRSLFTAIPDAKDNLTLLEVAPQRVYAQFVLTGHIGGAEAKPVSIRIMSVYQVSDRHIVADDTYYDRKM